LFAAAVSNQAKTTAGIQTAEVEDQDANRKRRRAVPLLAAQTDAVFESTDDDGAGLDSLNWLNRMESKRDESVDNRL
jgi:hypothetical protein